MMPLTDDMFFTLKTRAQYPGVFSQVPSQDAIKLRLEVQDNRYYTTLSLQKRKAVDILPFLLYSSLSTGENQRF